MPHLLSKLVVMLPLVLAGSALAAPSGAIFTTLGDGSEVNLNKFPAKEAVYLDGGPGIGAPATAAGLDDGVYVFQVTDPSGKVLLSTDPAGCRQLTVKGGIIIDVDPSGACAHETGIDLDHAELGATTVQLYPYADTPNPGGVYKAWVTPVGDFLAACPGGLDIVDCGYTAGHFHGFVPAHAKTDNFKIVQPSAPREIDTYFIDHDTRVLLEGRYVIWIDPLGVENTRWSHYMPWWDTTVAHIESLENGVHQIVIEDQPGCLVHWVQSGKIDDAGPRTLSFTFRGSENKLMGPTIRVYCLPNP